MASNNLESILVILFVQLLVFLIACIIAKYIWIQYIGVEIPIDRKFYDVQFRKKKFYCSTSSFTVFWSFYYKIVSTFNKEYFTLN